MVGKPLKLIAGRKYALRDGSVVELIERRTVPYREGKTGKPSAHHFWLGQLIGYSGEFLTWQADGSYSPVCESGLDIVRLTK